MAGRRRRGAWYWWVTLLSAGLLAAIPMWHAYLRLRTPRQLKVALSLTGLDVLLFALSSASPDSGPTGAAGALYGAVLIVTLIVAVVSVLAVRPLAYPAEEVAAPEPALPLTAGDDAALAAALAQREQRARSRAIVEQDPSLARDLRIGRPDLHGEYDDGGLVDVNSAPVEVIGQVLGLPPDVAQDVVDARVRFSGFQNVEELLACVVLTEGQTEVVKDRAVALPL